MKAWPVLATLALVLLLTGCTGDETTVAPAASPSPSALSAAAIARQHGLQLWPEAATTVVPESFSEVPWSLYQSACLASGFDLRPYRGQEVVFAAHRLRDTHEGDFAMLNTISAGNRIVGAFVTVPGEYPGVYSLTEAGSWQ